LPSEAGIRQAILRVRQTQEPPRTTVPVLRSAGALVEALGVTMNLEPVFDILAVIGAVIAFETLVFYVGWRIGHRVGHREGYGEAWRDHDPLRLA
jgi:hypothetical protein